MKAPQELFIIVDKDELVQDVFYSADTAALSARWDDKNGRRGLKVFKYVLEPEDDTPAATPALSPA